MVYALCRGLREYVFRETLGAAYKDLKEKFVAAAKALKVGNGLQEGVQMSPVVSKKHNPDVNTEVRIAADGAGNFVVVWPKFDINLDYYDIMARWFD